MPGHGLCNGGHVAAQEGIAGAFVFQSCRKRWHAGRTLVAGLRDTLRQRCVFRIDVLREGGVVQRVFVRTANPRVARQRRDAIQRSQHLGWRAFEQPPAAEAEKRVAAEQHATVVQPRVEGDVGEGVAGHGKYVEADAKLFDPDVFAIGHASCGQGDAILERSEHRNLEALQQRRNAADVVGVVVRHQDRDRFEAALARRKHWRSLTRIHDQRTAGLVGQRPDVVVREGRKRLQGKHGGDYTCPLCWKRRTMPAPIFRRQPDPLAAQAAAEWFDGEAGRGLLAVEAGLLAPVLGRYGGSHVLHLLPCVNAPRLPMDARTRHLTCLFRERDVWCGDLRSAAGNLPLRGDSMDAILAWHVLADAPERELLAAELLRVLAPEGVLVVVELDPWSLCRAGWGRRGPSAWPASAAIRQLRGIGFELVAREGLGARWSRGKARATHQRLTDFPLPARASYALSFSKHEAAGAAVGLAMA